MADKTKRFYNAREKAACGAPLQGCTAEKVSGAASPVQSQNVEVRQASVEDVLSQVSALWEPLADPLGATTCMVIESVGVVIRFCEPHQSRLSAAQNMVFVPGCRLDRATGRLVKAN